MLRHRLRSILIVIVCAVTTAFAAPARTAGAVSIAAAANLRYALEALDAAFGREQPAIKLTATFGASGSLLAQIEHGAPIDVFLSADTAYPKQLAAAGAGDPATLRTFAIGRLVLWTTHEGIDLTSVVTALHSPAIEKVAIARPETAPYGRAAEAVLVSLHVWDTLKPKLVVGENIAQTAQFVATGNADVGFVALSLLKPTSVPVRGHWIDVPPALYASVPLDHACVLTTHGSDNAAARRYLAFLESAAARAILEQFGYTVPESRPGSAR